MFQQLVPHLMLLRSPHRGRCGMLTEPSLGIRRKGIRVWADIHHIAGRKCINLSHIVFGEGNPCIDKPIRI